MEWTKSTWANGSLPCEWKSCDSCCIIMPKKKQVTQSNKMCDCYELWRFIMVYPMIFQLLKMFFEWANCQLVPRVERLISFIQSQKQESNLVRQIVQSTESFSSISYFILLVTSACQDTWGHVRSKWLTWEPLHLQLLCDSSNHAENVVAHGRANVNIRPQSKWRNEKRCLHPNTLSQLGGIYSIFMLRVKPPLNGGTL